MCISHVYVPKGLRQVKICMLNFVLVSGRADEETRGPTFATCYHSF
jgi:hypothetical protein